MAIFCPEEKKKKNIFVVVVFVKFQELLTTQGMLETVNVRVAAPITYWKDPIQNIHSSS